jgi:type IV pilus assembly protein PilW
MKNKQLGLTLLELLVVLAISSILMLGLVQIFADSGRTERYIDAQLETIDNSRFVDMILKGYIERAGYKHNPAANVFRAKTALNGCNVFLDGEFVTSYHKTGTENRGFCIRYQPSALLGTNQVDDFDCTGTARQSSESQGFRGNSSNDNIVMAVFFVPGVGSRGLENGELKCQTWQEDGTNQSAQQTVLSGIGDFHTMLMDTVGDVYEGPTTGMFNSNGRHFVGIKYYFLFASEAETRVGGKKGKSVFKELWISDVLTDASGKSNSNKISRINNLDEGNIFSITDGTVLFKNRAGNL